MAHASATLSDDSQSITLDKHTTTKLNVGDCIKFIKGFPPNNNNDKDTRETIIAKITAFGGNDGIATKIVYLPWRAEEGRWASPSQGVRSGYGRAIDLTEVDGRNGDWRTISKMDTCPDAVLGGRRRKLKLIKKTRKNRRHSRRRHH